MKIERNQSHVKEEKDEAFNENFAHKKQYLARLRW